MSVSLSWQTSASHPLKGGAHGDAGRKLEKIFGAFPIDLQYGRDYEKLKAMGVMDGGFNNIYKQLMEGLLNHNFITVTIDG